MTDNNETKMKFINIQALEVNSVNAQVKSIYIQGWLKNILNYNKPIKWLFKTFAILKEPQKPQRFASAFRSFADGENSNIARSTRTADRSHFARSSPKSVRLRKFNVAWGGRHGPISGTKAWRVFKQEVNQNRRKKIINSSNCLHSLESF